MFSYMGLGMVHGLGLRPFPCCAKLGIRSLRPPCQDLASEAMSRQARVVWLCMFKISFHT
jgi:hypothetical protein